MINVFSATGQTNNIQNLRILNTILSTVSEDNAGSDRVYWGSVRVHQKSRYNVESFQEEHARESAKIGDKVKAM